jgi:peroxiredoxin (alkyl hydroperoxide reductase subunit C)
MEEPAIGCARPTGSVVGAQPAAKDEASTRERGEVGVKSIMVGRPAPDFTAPAYHKGAFTQVRLSDLLGKWVVLCFYPGDFTFV